MTIPLVNGSATVSLHANNRVLLNQAINFYTNIVGFSLHSTDEDEVYLASKDCQVVLKLSITPTSYTEDEIAHLKVLLQTRENMKDWRTVEKTTVFGVSNLNSLIQTLEAFEYETQVTPSELYPNEVYTIDPLGHVVGFTSSVNPVSIASRIHKKEITSHEQSIYMSTATSISEQAIEVDENPTQRNVAVMTSGGDAPGMNAIVYAVVRAAIFKGCKAFCVMEGYKGLVRGGPDEIKEMLWKDVRGFLSDGGTNIGTARCMEFKERKGRLQACKNLIEGGIDALIVCGGDGSLTGADLFRSEWPSLIKELKDNNAITNDKYERHKNLNICGTVGSIDNDMATTDATIGAFSALARICRAIDYIDATANSHSRAFVVEVMGRHCGWLALMAGLATSADYILIPEKPASSKGWEDQMCDIVKKHRENGKRKTIVIVAEGAITSDLTPISSDDVKDVLVRELGLDTRVTTLGHVQRGGSAVAFDRVLGILQGIEAVNAVLDCKPNSPSPMIGIRENKIVRRPLVEAVEITKSVAEAISRKDFSEAMNLRDSEFIEHLNDYIAINSAHHIAPTLNEDKRKRIAIVNVGAPAGGMNSAVYAMATYCMSRGHVPYAIHNGFSGLARHESVRLLEWLDIVDWNSIGGLEIGTNRETPATDIGMVAYYFEKYKFDGLIIVGGFEAFVSLNELEQYRAVYPAFRIPMVLIPATISNNVPGTEYSLGSDTCLNALIEYCDVVKQSASATRDRAFVIEVQGGNSGYIASYAALATAAQASYVPEEGIPLEQLSSDFRSLAESFAIEKGMTKAGKLILKSNNASKALSSQVIADILNAESKGEFDAKTAIPGHVQQGGLPSPIDRTRGARFAVRAVEFIEKNCGIISPSKYAFDFPADDTTLSSTASVLGIKSSHLKFTSIRKLFDFETVLSERMPKNIFWNDLRDISDQLVGRTRISRTKY